ncbi:MAG: glycerophosphodiester phosphodiesterase [Spirochaetales bacterium]|nr:glycerophosphodiester phosphodiesterase [Spirochaetales bacterium]
MARKKVFEKPLLFGHRGDSAHHTENTLTAFEACIEAKIDGIELDVQLCKSGQLVVFHDSTLSRLCGIDRRVDEMTLDELKEVRLPGDEQIPTLSEVFSTIGSHLVYDLELKSRSLSSTGLEAATLALIEEHQLSKNCYVSSFNPTLVWRFQRLGRRAIPTAVIYSHSTEVPRPLRKGQGQYVVRPTFLKPEHSQAFAALKGRRQVLTWTVDDPQEAKALLDAGVMGIISNNPRELLPLFRG